MLRVSCGFLVAKESLGRVICLFQGIPWVLRAQTFVVLWVSLGLLCCLRVSWDSLVVPFMVCCLGSVLGLSLELLVELPWCTLLIPLSLGFLGVSWHSLLVLLWVLVCCLGAALGAAWGAPSGYFVDFPAFGFPVPLWGEPFCCLYGHFCSLGAVLGVV